MCSFHGTPWAGESISIFFGSDMCTPPKNYHGIWKWTPWKKEMPNLKTHHFQVRAVSFRVQVVYNNIISRCTDWACGFSPFLWQKKNGSKQAKGIRDEAIYVFICLYIVRIYLPILISLKDIHFILCEAFSRFSPRQVHARVKVWRDQQNKTHSCWQIGQFEWTKSEGLASTYTCLIDFSSFPYAQKKQKVDNCLLGHQNIAPLKRLKTIA